MRTAKDIVEQALAEMTAAGAQKAQCTLHETRLTELNLQEEQINFMRTTVNTSVTLRALADGREGKQNVNQTDEASIRQAAQAAVAAARAAQPDEAFDISPFLEAQSTEAGDAEPDLDTLYARFAEFVEQVRQRYPQIRFDSTSATFAHQHSMLANTNGVRLSDRRGVYGISIMCLAVDGDKTASFNGAGFTAWKLDQPILDRPEIRVMLEQEVEHLDPKPLEGKFVGDVVLSPDCLAELLLMPVVQGMLGDGGLIAGTSPLRDKLGETIAAPCVTLRCNPEDMPGGYRFTDDGFPARNTTIIENGVLKGFVLSLYGANKTGKARGENPGGCYALDPGDMPLDSIIAGIERGVLLCRFSGGMPSDSGDFSGVAKNSFLIENGKIVCPLSETMVAGNQLQLLRDVVALSRERVDSGGMILPWMHCKGVTISGR